MTTMTRRPSIEIEREEKCHFNLYYIHILFGSYASRYIIYFWSFFSSQSRWYAVVDAEKASLEFHQAYGTCDYWIQNLSIPSERRSRQANSDGMWKGLKIVSKWTAPFCDKNQNEIKFISFYFEKGEKLIMNYSHFRCLYRMHWQFNSAAINDIFDYY